MPSYYQVQCYACGYNELRYRNVKRCPECGEFLERIMPECICFHGTNEASANNILREGFRAGTWFARHLEDAIWYGGLHIFEVVFKTEGLPANWQVHYLKEVSVDKIVGYYLFTRNTIIDNEKLRRAVLKGNTFPHNKGV